jgi:hypothetical protein
MNKRVKIALLVVFIVLVIVGFMTLTQVKDPAKTWQDADVKKDKSRFLPEQSVDIGMAMKIITHGPPQMLAPPEKQPPLVLFPPSEDELKRLSGE